MKDDSRATAELLPRRVSLPADREYVPIKSIAGLVGNAMLAYVEAKHINDEKSENDPDHDPAAQAQFDLGFNNPSTDLRNIRKAVLEHRAAGRIVVREGDGLGVVYDEDVERGCLTRRDFKVFVGLVWGMDTDGDQLPDLTPQPLQRGRAQEAAILAKLAELGFDPQVLLPAPAGKASPAKQAVRDALGYSRDVMNKAWQRLRAAGSIKDARP